MERYPWDDAFAHGGRSIEKTKRKRINTVKAEVAFHAERARMAKTNVAARAGDILTRPEPRRDVPAITDPFAEERVEFRRLSAFFDTEMTRLDEARVLERILDFARTVVSPSSGTFLIARTGTAYRHFHGSDADTTPWYDQLFPILLSTGILRKKLSPHGVRAAMSWLRNCTNIPDQILLPFAETLDSDGFATERQTIELCAFGLRGCKRVSAEFLQALARSMKKCPSRFNGAELRCIFLGLQNLEELPDELVQSLTRILRGVDGVMDERDFSICLQSIRNYRFQPQELLLAFTKALRKIPSPMNPVELSCCMQWIRYSANVPKEMLARIATETGRSEWKGTDFLTTQAIVISLAHMGIPLPPALRKHWSRLKHSEGPAFTQRTMHERLISKRIRHDPNFRNYEIRTGEYLYGYEVDVVLRDTSGNIFALIESDGKYHSEHAKKQKDARRDALLLKKFPEACIIRCRSYGKADSGE